MEKLELSADEMAFLSDLVSGRCGRDFWNDNALNKLAMKLRNMRDEKIYGTPSAGGYSLSR